MASELTSISATAKLNDANKIPILGFGAYEMDSREAYEAVTWALEIGYRHFEAVQWFENEKPVGRAIRHFCERSGVPRSEIFYASKLKENKGYEQALESIKRAVKECELGYIDLFTIHSPIGGAEARRESWRALVDAKKEGLIKSIGIGFFGVKHIQEILALNNGVPAVLQIELHPFNQRKDIVALCKEHDITLEAWRPLVHGMRFDHPTIQSTAEKYNKQEAQIFLRWAIQKGYIPITMSGSQKRLIYDARIFDFELTEEDMKNLDGLDEGLFVDENPADCE
jgi:diketogulonate reductase-like aldo/keto reductase